MSHRLADRAATVGRAGAAALLAAALAASMQQSRVGTAASLAAGLTLAASAFALWSVPSSLLWRVLPLSSSGLFLIAAAGVTLTSSPMAFALARAAGPLAAAAAAVSLLPRRPAWWAAAGGLVAGGVHLLLFDPFLDPNCRGCAHAGIAIWADTGRAERAWIVGWLLLLGALLVGIRQHPTFAVPAIASGVVYAVHPSRPELLIVGVVAATATWIPRCWRLRQRRVKLKRLLASYELTGADLTQSLRSLLADPSLKVGFPVVATSAGPADGASTVFVDAGGEPLPEANGSFTDIRSGGELLARVIHEAELPDRAGELLDPITTLTLYRQRATVQLAAEVRELTERRRRVASAGLAARSELERDLHDGVQQELLALGLDIRLAIARCETHDGEQAGSLATALALVHESVDQVRAISTGVSPPMLATHGIRGAIGALSRRRGIDVDTAEITAERFPAEIELAAFAALSEALVNGSTELRAEVRGVTLRLAADHTANAGTNPARSTPVGSLTDLFAALGGLLVTDGLFMEATLPCAS